MTRSERGMMTHLAAEQTATLKLTLDYFDSKKSILEIPNETSAHLGDNLLFDSRCPQSQDSGQGRDSS